MTRDAALQRKGIAACRQALDQYGLLLVQDATVPSATSIVVGEHALVNVGNAHDPWQLDGLSTRASELLALIEASSTQVRADELAPVVAKPAEALRELELRLLVITSEVHTESGRHAKAALGWRAWASEHQLRTPDLRPPADSRQSCRF